MSLKDKIFNRFYKTQPLQKSDAIVVEDTRDKIAQEENINKVVNQKVEERVKEEMFKAEALAVKEGRSMRMRVPIGFNQSASNENRLASFVPFWYLRRMADTYPVARACINRRIKQMTSLKWDVTTKDDDMDEKGFEGQILEAKQFFKRPMGPRSRFSEMVNTMIEDLLVVDATCFEYQKTRGGEFMYLVPVDPTTIVLRVTDQGRTPTPPATAYAQYISGKKIADFSINEMLYESVNHRSHTPYGLAPLESLIIQVESALRGALYNLAYFKESNVPEGFVTLPDDVAANLQQVQEWQNWFDAMLSGDPRFLRRLKILPGGAEYTAAKKPEDMSFERFELWLLQVTCAVFDVQPQDIGFTYQVNKATGETQSDIGKERGLIPMANFVKEVFDDLLEFELFYPDLQFMWVDINPVDRAEEVNIAEKEINMGALSVDEYRTEQGREPIGLGHYVKTGSGPVLVDAVINGETGQQTKDTSAEDESKDELEEIRRWRKVVFNDIEKGRPIRYFKTDKISLSTQAEISKALKGVQSRLQAKYLFDQYLDPEIKASMKLLKLASDMRRIENAEILED